MLKYTCQSDGVLTPEAATQLRSDYKEYLNAELAAIDSYVPPALEHQAQWTGVVWPSSKDAQANPDTGVQEDVLKEVGKASVTVPEGFVRG